MACVVAGAHLDDPTHPVFESITKMLESIEPDSRSQIRSWLDETKVELQEQASDSWAAVALGAAKVALDMTGFATADVRRADLKITAHDTQEPSKTITIDVDPATASLTYDVSGYQGRSCEAVEKKLISNLESVLGVSIPSSARVSKPKPESYLRGSEPNIQSNLPGGPGSRTDGLREKQRG